MFQALLNNLDIGVAITSTRGVIQYSNPCFAEMIGAPLFKTVKGQELQAFVVAGSWVALEKALRQAANVSLEGKLELESLGRRRTVRVTLLPLRNEQGEPQIGIVATEITELLEANRALKESKAALQTVSARLLQVQDEERRHMARDLHDTIGQELAVAVMRVEQMAKQVSSPEVDLRKELMECSEWLRKVETETRTLSYVLHPPLLDQIGLVPALRWYIEGFSKRSGLKVKVDAACNVPRLEIGQETALFRIVQESLTNVLRHSGSSEARVRVSIEGDHVCVSIEDRGRGFQHRPSEKQKPEFGVGIAGMRGRLSLVDGALDIRTSEQGTTVSAMVPLPTGEKGKVGTTEWSGALRPAPESPASPVAAGSVARILIADDHEIARRGIRDLFRDEADLEICGEASDGLEALARVEELRPDLLILDLSMPKVGGFSVAHRLRHAEPPVKILLYSTHSHTDIERMARSSGCMGCVHKANAARDLVRGARAVLAGKTFFECDAVSGRS